MRFRTISLVLWCGLGVLRAAAPDPANSKSIKTFINCINDVLIAAAGPTDISMTVASCIPDNACFMTGTSNESSAQPACTLDLPNAKKTVYFPRILLSCPGSAADRRFRPSYTLCPTKSDSAGLFDSQRIEIGEDTGPVDVTKPDGGKMVMSDVPVPPKGAGRFLKIDPNFTYNLRANSKKCDECHQVMNQTARAGTLELSGPIDNFTEDDPSSNRDSELDLNKKILFTDEPNRPFGGARAPLHPMSFADVCSAITANKAEIVTVAQGKNNQVTAASVDVIEKVCQNLLAKKKR